MTQKEALDIMKMGYNVFLTGQAGTGKTHVLNSYIKYLKDKNVVLGITASTGIAATHMDGVTIDSWSGLGIKDELTDEDVRNLHKKMYLRIRLLSTKVLIIDEVSMLHAHRFDLINKILKIFRKSDKPFGGVQVILSGDFFQLPPVSNTRGEPDYIYKSPSWKEMDVRICYLDRPYRQADPDFLSILNSIRRNDITDDTFQILIKTIGQQIPGGIPPTKLYTHNVDVDAINLGELDKIPETPHTYEMTSSGLPKLVESMKKNCLAPEKLELKKGAIVMFVKNNFEKGFVNGTMGKVESFDRENNPVVKTTDGRVIHTGPAKWTIAENNITRAEISQIPLRLAWAITIHKSQGMTLDEAEIDLSKTFSPGMGYVALSRVKSLKGLRLLGINNLALQVNPEVIEFDRQMARISEETSDNLKKLGLLKKIMKQREFMFKITS